MAIVHPFWMLTKVESSNAKVQWWINATGVEIHNRWVHAGLNRTEDHL
jgi:hypothetical protein